MKKIIYNLCILFLLLWANSTKASTLCITGYCDPITITPITLNPNPPVVLVHPQPLLLPPLFLTEISRTGDFWRYVYSAHTLYINPVNSFTLPFIQDQEISSVQSPNNWRFEIGTDDIFNLGQGTGYMRWTFDGVTSDSINPTFSFLSPWAPGLGPFSFTTINGDQGNVNGTPLPRSPLAISLGLAADTSAVPLPSAITYFVIAISTLIFPLCHRRLKSN